MNSTRMTQRIADEAARLLARQESPSLDAARRKAAARLGARSRADWPDDARIVAALQAYRTLFGGADDPTMVAERLALAEQAMRFMADFAPELAESAEQAADPAEAPLRILLYSEDPDGPLHRLMEAGMHFTQRRSRLLRGPGERVEVDVLVVRDQGLEVAFWPLQPNLRGAALSDSPLGDPLSRLGLAAISARVAATR